MALTHDIVILGASHVNEDGVPVVQALLPHNDTSDEGEPFGEVDLMTGLGDFALPWPKDETGHAEGVILRRCGNRDAVLIGARDTRTSKMVGNMKPGDRVLTSTGPNRAAQLQLKEEKRQVVAVTKDTEGKTVAVIVDGKNDKIQITGFGMMFEMSREHGISLVDNTGKATLLLKDGNIHVLGTVVLGGMVPNPALAIMMGPKTGSPGGVASPPMIAAKGVFIGQ